MTVPSPIIGACAWRGEEMARSTRWIRRLDAAAVAEIDAALDAARSAGVPWHGTTRERFPLPGLSAVRAEGARELEDGCGRLEVWDEVLALEHEAAVQRAARGTHGRHALAPLARRIRHGSQRGEQGRRAVSPKGRLRHFP